MKTQNERLISLMRQQWMTPLSALQLADCLNFSARVTEIRRILIGTGKELKSMWVNLGLKRVKAYRIVRIK